MGQGVDKGAREKGTRRINKWAMKFVRSDAGQADTMMK